MNSKQLKANRKCESVCAGTRIVTSVMIFHTQSKKKRGNGKNYDESEN